MCLCDRGLVGVSIYSICVCVCDKGKEGESVSTQWFAEATHTQQLEVLIYSLGRVLDRPLQLSEQFHCGLQNLMDTISMYAKSHNRSCHFDSQFKPFSEDVHLI